MVSTSESKSGVDSPDCSRPPPRACVCDPGHSTTTPPSFGSKVRLTRLRRWQLLSTAQRHIRPRALGLGHLQRSTSHHLRSSTERHSHISQTTVHAPATAACIHHAQHFQHNHSREPARPRPAHVDDRDPSSAAYPAGRHPRDRTRPSARLGARRRHTSSPVRECPSHRRITYSPGPAASIRSDARRRGPAHTGAPGTRRGQDLEGANMGFAKPWAGGCRGLRRPAGRG
ncbi:hypothetical protein BC628DRAFT_470429 [Trametes gibbosa]|nr:hypothetical protein BC628DRAFT_470429 [Trametes gibbosa]